MSRSASHGEAGYERIERDAYFTDPWVIQALLSAVKFDGPIWEPACGDGRMAREIAANGYPVIVSDIHNYGYPGTIIANFLEEPAQPESIGAIITNPPFDLAREFVIKAIDRTRRSGGKIAILQRHEFDAPKRNHSIFELPFSCKLILPRRPKWFSDDKASPRFPFAWYLWDWSHQGPPTIRWLT